MFVAASTLLSALPRAWSVGLAHGLGRLAGRLPSSRRRVVLENLRCTDVTTGWDRASREALVRATLGHACALGFDVLTLSRVAREPRRYCELPRDSEELLAEAAARGRGVLLVASHFGLMESMGLVLGEALSALGQQLSFVAKPFPNAALDRAIRRRREATGNRTIHKGGAKATLLEVLGRREFAAIVLDQHVAPHARIWVPFLGLPAATARTLGTVAVETGASVVPIHSFPLPRGRCRVECGPLLTARSDLEPAEAARELVERAVAVQDAAVRRDPAAWNWIHRRWKVHPDGEGSAYPDYAISESEEGRREATRSRSD